MKKILMRVFYVVIFMYVSNTALAFDFKLNDINGKPHKLSDYKGKWVIVNYWATWCPPCLDEIPELVDFHEKHKNNDAVVLGINYEDVDPKYLKEFVDQYFISYPILPTDPSKPGFWGPITGFPTTYIISPAGELVLTQVGRVDGKFLEEVINSKPKHALK